VEAGVEASVEAGVEAYTCTRMCTYMKMTHDMCQCARPLALSRRRAANERRNVYSYTLVCVIRICIVCD